MRSTLFHIPGELFGYPVFGVGLLLAVCVVGSLVTLAVLVRRHGLNKDTGSYALLLGAICAVVAFVLPAICDPRGLPIRGYGTMLLIAVLAAVGLAVWRGKSRGFDAETVINLSFWAFVPGMIGARVFYVIEYWEDYQRDTLLATLREVVSLDHGGMVVYGSFIGASLGILGYIVKNRLHLLATLDLLAPSMVLGTAIGRLGCFLNGCCFGGPCELPWAVTFPTGSPAHYHQVRHGQVSIHGLRLQAGPDHAPVIAGVAEGSPAAAAGVPVGAKILSINGQPVGGTVSLDGKNVAGIDAAYHWMLLADATDEIAVAVRPPSGAGPPGEDVGHDKTASEAAPDQPPPEVKDDPKVYRWKIEPPRDPLGVHPTQLYSSINALLICLFLLALAPYCRRDGQVWAALLTIYPVTRFLLEIIRKDEPEVFGTQMSISQNVSLVLLAVAVALWIYTWRWGRKTGEA